MSQLLRCEPPGVAEREVPCSCGHKARFREMRARHVLTAVGQVEFLRPWYLCSHCHNGQCPVDAALSIEKTEFSPGIRRMLALVGSNAPFDQGRQQIELLAGLEVTTKAVERTAESAGGDIAMLEQKALNQAIQLDLPIIVGEPIPILYIQMDGTGVPVVKKETEGRVGKVEGQPSHTREVKFGCVFTQTAWDDEGYAIRDPGSTTYTGAIEQAGEFGNRIYLEAWNRGWSRAEKKVVIGDGAEWIWNNADRHFPGAVQIVDLFHARQHLWGVARLIHPGDIPRQKQWMLRHQPKLDGGKIEKLVRFLRGLNASTPSIEEVIRIEAAYFEHNAQRMRYPEFRRQHLFVGSGVIEAGCKTVIGSRLKQSGMFWTVSGANAIIALRCCHLNNRIEDYWESRRAA
ncbi:MAG: ISKra4 family transposase [Acidobacteriota bacterium]|nr:ISKra4 family transposase [Acidobacteriota bacterium]